MISTITIYRCRYNYKSNNIIHNFKFQPILMNYHKIILKNPIQLPLWDHYELSIVSKKKYILSKK